MEGAGARERKAAEKEADVILKSLSEASEAGHATCLNQVVAILKDDPPLMYHINALLHNEEWKNVLKHAASAPATKPDTDQNVEESGSSRDRPLRATCKKIEHLKRRRFVDIIHRHHSAGSQSLK